MTKTLRRWLLWSAAAAMLAAAAAGLWFAYARGWLAPAETWATGIFHRKEAGGTDASGMNMPGMNMPGVSTGQTSAVPGYTEVTIPYQVQQRIGVTLGTVEKAPLEMTVRTVGIVQPDETKVDHVHLKTEGWITKVFVNYTGQEVKENEKLLAIYSPEFVTTQETYLNDRKIDRSLAALDRQRLKLWDVPDDEIKDLESSGKARTELTLRSPLTGTVLTKNAFAGQYVMPEKDLYVVADLSTVWVQAKVYEYELPHIELGRPVSVTFTAYPDRPPFPGKVAFIQPTVEEPARTVEVRVELKNPDGLFKPGMYANLVIHHTMGEGLLVPDSAVIRTGERDIVLQGGAGRPLRAGGGEDRPVGVRRSIPGSGRSGRGRPGVHVGQLPDRFGKPPAGERRRHGRDARHGHGR